MKYSAGIGSRETPQYVLGYFNMLGAYLAEKGFMLRSGAAQGADIAFEIGCDKVNGQKEIYLPWKNFAGSESDLVVSNPEAYQIAEYFHPYWHNLKDGAKPLQARNSHQILGWDLRTPSNFVICWTKDGKGLGGTGQAIRVAEYYNIPVFDAGKYSTTEYIKAGLKRFFIENKILSEEELAK